jgi:hypothetical protein
MNSRNNLKHMGLAFHNYQEDGRKALPPGGTFDDKGNALHGWQTQLLPYIEQMDLYRKIDQAVPWSHSRNAEHFRTTVKEYLYPSVEPRNDDAGFALGHYAANVRLIGGNPRSLKNIPDGAANTILAGEVWARYSPWGRPGNWRDPARGIRTTPDSFGSPQLADSVQFVMADGSVRTVKKSVDLAVLKALSTPDGGEPISPGDW